MASGAVGFLQKNVCYVDFVEYAILKHNSWPQRCMVAKQKMVPNMWRSIVVPLPIRSRAKSSQHQMTNQTKLSFIDRDLKTCVSRISRSKHHDHHDSLNDISNCGISSQ